MKQLTFNFQDADDKMIQQQATAGVANGDFNNWHHAYESLWDLFEEELKYEKTIYC